MPFWKKAEQEQLKTTPVADIILDLFMDDFINSKSWEEFENKITSQMEAINKKLELEGQEKITEIPTEILDSLHDKWGLQHVGPDY